MPVTIRNTDILFNNGTTQSTAATPVSTDFGAVGTYAVLMNAASSNLATGGTRAGSDLRFDPVINSTSGGLGSPFYWNVYAPNAFYNGGGSSVSGTWRKMSPGSVYFQTGDGYGGTLRWYGYALYVRIS